MHFLPYILTPKHTSCLRCNSMLRISTACVTSITMNNRGQIITECNSHSSGPLLWLCSLLYFSEHLFSFFPTLHTISNRSTPHSYSSWQHLFCKKMGAMWHQFPPFSLCLPQNSVSSSSPSCYNLGSSLTLLEKAMAPHSSTLAWKIPRTEEPGGLQSMGSRRVRHKWATSPSLFTLMPWRRKWQPTPVFLPGESQGQEGLVGYRLWGRRESDTTEAT